MQSEIASFICLRNLSNKRHTEQFLCKDSGKGETAADLSEKQWKSVSHFSDILTLDRRNLIN